MPPRSGYLRISERLIEIEKRDERGRQEIDTIRGAGCEAVVTDRRARPDVVLIGALRNLTAAALERARHRDDPQV